METEKAGPSLAMRAVAVLVLLVAAWILLKVVIGLIAGIAWFIVIVAALVAVVWAWSTLRS
jgi:hypothetical protein